MKAQHVISPLKGITAEAIEIQPGAAGHQYFSAALSMVVDAFEPIAPRSVFMDLVENPQRGTGQLAFEDALAVFGDVPTQIARGCSRQA